MKLYRIIESIFNDEYGKEQSKHYFVQKRKSFLGIKYWSDIKHEVCGYGDCYNITTQFKCPADAYEFVTTVLCNQDKRNTWKNTIVNVLK
jgi:hypothetical protein